MSIRVGDIVRIKISYYVHPGMVGTVIEDYAMTNHNTGKAFRLLLANGKIKTIMAKNLEVISESRQSS